MVVPHVGTDCSPAPLAPENEGYFLQRQAMMPNQTMTSIESGPRAFGETNGDTKE